MTTTSTDQMLTSNAGAVLITALLTGFVAAAYGFGIYLFAQLVPDMRGALNFDYATVGLLTAIAQFGFLVFALVGGWLTTRIGGGLVAIGSIIVTGTCLVLVPLMQSVIGLGILLTVMGAMAASVYVPMVELVGRTIRFEYRGRVLGLISSGTSYGVFLTSLLVPVFLAAKDWQSVWMLVGGLTLAMAAAGIVTFRQAGLLSGGRSPVAAQGPRTARAQPTSRVWLIQWVMIILVMTFLNGFSTLPFQNYLSPYLREELSFSVDFASQVWTTIGIIGMVAGFAVGWLSDKTGVRFALAFCYSCVACAAGILVFAPYGLLPMLAGVMFAIAFYPIFGLIPAYVSKAASPGVATHVFALANVTVGLGGIAGNYLAGVLKSAAGSFVLIYVAIGVIAALLLALTFLLPNESAENPDAV